MYIHNVRYGFATNSSSAHSVVMLKGGMPLNVNDACNSCFGWDTFTITSQKDKRVYLGQCLKDNFTYAYGLIAEDAALVASGWAGALIDPDGYVDHQSVITFPYEKTYKGAHISKGFFSELLKYVLDKRVAIFGGNDNDIYAHPHASYVDTAKTSLVGDRLFQDCAPRSVRCRYDETGRFWTLFNKSYGNKIRISFDKDADAEKSEAPELVDLKITNKCRMGCTYCYQGSTVKGKHAAFGSIEAVLKTLRDADVFEVALGGGEPTTHPEFMRIIDTCCKNDLIVNFSTRNAHWLLNKWHHIQDKVGAVGFSVDNVHDSRYVIKHLNNVMGDKLMIQVVVGSTPDIEKILKACFDNCVCVLLLGWKHSKRGSEGPKHKVNLEAILDTFLREDGGRKYWDGPSLSFDTVLADSMQPWLIKNSDVRLFTIADGKHSMYIDCVEGIMAKSSYDLEGSETFDVEATNRKDKLLQYFKSM